MINNLSPNCSGQVNISRPIPYHPSVASFMDSANCSGCCWRRSTTSFQSLGKRCTVYTKPQTGSQWTRRRVYYYKINMLLSQIWSTGVYVDMQDQSPLPQVVQQVINDEIGTQTTLKHMSWSRLSPVFWCQTLVYSCLGHQKKWGCKRTACQSSIQVD